MFDLISTIKEILLGFFDACGTFFTWVGELINDIADVAVNGAKALSNAVVWVGQILPSPVSAIFGTILAVVVVYKILGREG